MHYNRSASPPLGRSYNAEWVRSILREAERVNANRGSELGRIPILPWVWYRYLNGNYSSYTSLLQPVDMHTALAEPGIAGADGVLVYEDGAAQEGMPMFVETDEYMQEVLGPIAAALYGSAKLSTAAGKTDDGEPASWVAEIGRQRPTVADRHELTLPGSAASNPVPVSIGSIDWAQIPVQIVSPRRQALPASA